MTMVDILSMQQHAKEQNYKLVMVSMASLAMARGILEAATEYQTPVILSLGANTALEELMPSLEMMARRADPPVALVANNIHSLDQANRAIRLGCNGLIFDIKADKSVMEEIEQMAKSCALPILDQELLSEFTIVQKLETETLKAIDSFQASWQQLEQKVAHRAKIYMQKTFASSLASGKGQEVLESCRMCRPIEHLIIYNTNIDDEKTAELAARGRQVLDRIPGVRATWSGYSVKPDAGYRWCWLIRFANASVIDSYRKHPDHVAYADNYFRPFSADRVSIDYELIGADEPEH